MSHDSAAIQPAAFDLIIDSALATARRLQGEEGASAVQANESSVSLMAPWQTGRDEDFADVRDDLRELGTEMYRLATGKLPFREPGEGPVERSTRPPVAPVELRPDIPPTLNDIILRLLGGDPARRYQRAAGLAHDLARLRRALGGSGTLHFALGERDFPVLLPAPAILVGRDAELEELNAAFRAACAGSAKALLVTGAAGTGKSRLIDALRTKVVASNGRYARGNSEPGSSDVLAILVRAVRSLGRLLLTEPDGEVAATRARILEVLGPHAAVLCELPELCVILGIEPAAPSVDPLQASARLTAALLRLLRALASRERPLVLVLDNLEDEASLARFVDHYLSEPGLGSVLLVASARGPLSLGRHISKFLAGGRLRIVRLERLDENAQARMLEAMLRLQPGHAMELARGLDPVTQGNPYDIIELVNALRQDGVLVHGEEGWRWDGAGLASYARIDGLHGILEARIGRLEPAKRALLQTLACLGPEIELSLARAASGLEPHELDEGLAVLTGEGLVGREGAFLGLRHEGIRQGALSALGEPFRAEMHLVLARNLARDPAFVTAAAHQYVEASAAVRTRADCLSAARLLREAAHRAKTVADHHAERRFLESALGLLEFAGRGAAGADEIAIECRIDLHLAQTALGALEEADAIFAALQEALPEAALLADAACVQIGNLTGRSRAREAVELAVQCLREWGVDVPVRFDPAGQLSALAKIRTWFEQFDVAVEGRRPPVSETKILATARMLGRMHVAAMSTRNLGMARWIVIEAHGLWQRHGPCAPLAATLTLIGVHRAALGDWQTGRLACQHMTRLCVGQGWQHELCQVNSTYGTAVMHWHEPLEAAMACTDAARGGLLAHGDLHTACSSFRASIAASLDIGPTLDDYELQITAGRDLARRCGLDQLAMMFAADLQLLRHFRGQTQFQSFDDGDFIEARYLLAIKDDPIAQLGYHAKRCVAAAIAEDATTLALHSAHARKSLQTPVPYQAMWVYWLSGLSAAWALQGCGQLVDGQQTSLEQDLVGCVRWIEARAQEAPANFRHIALHLQAERAWAAGDTALAKVRFEEAVAASSCARRPWHHALILERAARFSGACGHRAQGQQLAESARAQYAAWGAWGKLCELEGPGGEQLERLRKGLPARQSQADRVDALAVFRAVQAIAVERSSPKLRKAVQEVLASLAGATRVTLVLWHEALQAWTLPPEGAASDPACAEDSPTLVPLTAMRYVQRTREPLLLEDAIEDERFARDPYFESVGMCSLMVVPISNRGQVKSILILENTAGRGAFDVARMDAVLMIAGQLAVSLESAQLYEQLEERVCQQSRELDDVRSRLAAEARRAGMAQVATNALHNVGNVLTSVNVSAHVLAEKVRSSRSVRVGQVAQLLQDDADAEKQRLVPAYLAELGSALKVERDELLAELQRLGSSVDHIKNVVSMQQAAATTRGVLEPADICDLVDDALRLEAEALAADQVLVERAYAEVETIALDKTRVMQVLVNLVANARQAMKGQDWQRRLRVQVFVDEEHLCVSVQDTGCGIEPGNMERLFSHGFTTKAAGHGFGLHSSAAAAREMGGKLAVASGGAGKGSTFTLRLPKTGIVYRRSSSAER